MLMYWFIYFIPASMTLLIKQSKQFKLIPWLLLGFLFILVIGFRHEVGCDWYNYLWHYERTIGVTFAETFITGNDPGHNFVNWVMAKWDFGVYGVNFVYAILFVIGLIRFSRMLPYPWLALAVSVPYMIMVVSMGYSRQGVALGLFMLAITYIEKRKFKSYVVWVLIAALFHKSAILLLPFGLFLSKGGMWIRVVIMIPVFYGAWDLLLAEKQEHLWVEYVEKQRDSSGAYIRVFMNFIPAVLFLIFRKKWKREFADYPFWFWVSIASIASVVMVGFATTAVDRVALYFIPIQLAVFSRLPYLARGQVPPNMTKVLIIVGYAAVLFVWLNFASHAHCWVPYQNILFPDAV